MSLLEQTVEQVHFVRSFVIFFIFFYYNICVRHKIFKMFGQKVKKLFSLIMGLKHIKCFKESKNKCLNKHVHIFISKPFF